MSPVIGKKLISFVNISLTVSSGLFEDISRHYKLTVLVIRAGIQSAGLSMLIEKMQSKNWCIFIVCLTFFLAIMDDAESITSLVEERPQRNSFETSSNRQRRPKFNKKQVKKKPSLIKSS